MTNPLDIIRQRKDAERLRSERRVELERRTVVEQFYEYFVDVEAQIEAREFRDCSIQNWDGQDYATFKFYTYDDYANKVGIPLYLFFNQDGDSVAILNPEEARYTHALSGGTPFDKSTISEVTSSDINNVKKTIILMALLKENAQSSDQEPWRQNPVHGSYISNELRLDCMLHGLRKARIEQAEAEA